MAMRERATTRGPVRGGRIAVFAIAAAFLGFGQVAAQPPGAVDASNPPPVERRLLLPAGGAQAAPAEGGGGVVDTLISLAIVLGLIFGCAAAVRKLSGSRGPLAAALGRAGRAPSGLIEILARYPLGRGQTLVLLRLDRRVLLLSQSVTGRFGCSATFTPLCEITDPEDVASILAKAQDEEGQSVAARFRSLLGRFDEPGDELEEGWTPRRAVAGDGDDRAELLTEPVESEPSVSAGSLRLSAAAPMAATTNGEGLDAIGSLRRRLETLRMAEGG